MACCKMKGYREACAELCHMALLLLLLLGSATGHRLFCHMQDVT